MNARKTILSLLVALMLLLGACSSAPADVVRIGWAGSPDTLNPGTGLLTESYVIYSLVYDSMYQYQLDGSYTLEAAESVTVSEDGLVYTYTLRDGQKFHDGTPLTAEDVVFSYNLYSVTEDFPYMPGYTAYFESVEATAPNQVTITLSEAIPNMESQLIYLFILPKHIWENVENPVEFENLEMIGSGPFKMAEYRQNEFVRLAANAEHPLNPPKVAGLVFQTFENQDALVQAIRTGSVDMINEMPNTAVESLLEEPNVKVVVGDPLAPDIADIILNQVNPDSCPTEDGGICSGHPALRDVTFRRALALATDKEKIIDIVLLGLGEPGKTLIPSGLGEFYNETLEDYPFDPASANELLDNAGYVDVDNDGIRDMPDGGRPLVLRVNYPSDSVNAPRMAELLKEQWAQIGVGVEIQALDADTLTSVCCPAFDYDVILWGWGSDPDPGFLLSVYLGTELSSGLNETGYDNPEYDSLFNVQAVELDDNIRRQVIWRMQEIVHRDVVYIVPFYAQAVQAYRTDRFTGWLDSGTLVALDDITSLVLVAPIQ